MLTMQSDPFGGLDRWFDRMSGSPSRGYAMMPLDAYRRGDDLFVHIDIPGVSPEEIDVNVERNVLSISVERTWKREDGDQVYMSERPEGQFRRQVQLGESLDTDNVEASCDNGVLTLRIPVSERAQPRKIAVEAGAPSQTISATSSESQS